MKTEKPKPFTFILRGLQWTTIIERTFCTDNEKDRNDWCLAIEHVASLLNMLTAEQQDVEMVDIRAQEEMRNKLHISTRTSTSRGRKIVSLTGSRIFHSILSF